MDAMYELLLPLVGVAPAAELDTVSIHPADDDDDSVQEMPVESPVQSPALAAVPVMVRATTNQERYKSKAEENSSTNANVH